MQHPAPARLQVITGPAHGPAGSAHIPLLAGIRDHPNIGLLKATRVYCIVFLSVRCPGAVSPVVPAQRLPQGLQLYRRGAVSLSEGLSFLEGWPGWGYFQAWLLAGGPKCLPRRPRRRPPQLTSQRERVHALEREGVCAAAKQATVFSGSLSRSVLLSLKLHRQTLVGCGGLLKAGCLPSTKHTHIDTCLQKLGLLLGCSGGCSLRQPKRHPAPPHLSTLPLLALSCSRAAAKAWATPCLDLGPSLRGPTRQPSWKSRAQLSLHIPPHSR